MASRQELAPKTHHLLYPDEFGMKEIVNGIGTRITIPRRFLFGRERYDEYSNVKRKAVEEEFKRDPNYLDKNPIITTIIQYQNMAVIAIIDGHHRNRYGPQFDKDEMPCIVLSVEELVTVLNKTESRHKKLNVTQAREKIQQEIVEAEFSFLKRGIPDQKLPTPIPFPAEISELKKYFSTGKAPIIDKK